MFTINYKLPQIDTSIRFEGKGLGFPGLRQSSHPDFTFPVNYLTLPKDNMVKKDLTLSSALGESKTNLF